jgi:hypothetical protein
MDPNAAAMRFRRLSGMDSNSGKVRDILNMVFSFCSETGLRKSCFHPFLRFIVPSHSFTSLLCHFFRIPGIIELLWQRCHQASATATGVKSTNLFHDLSHGHTTLALTSAYRSLGLTWRSPRSSHRPSHTSTSIQTTALMCYHGVFPTRRPHTWTSRHAITPLCVETRNPSPRIWKPSTGQHQTVSQHLSQP